MSTTPVRPVVVGLDGSRVGLAAADWAAHEALLRGVPLRLVHAWEQLIVPYASLAGVAIPPDPKRSARLLTDARARLSRRHPGLEVITDRIPGDPATALVTAGTDGELLVLGSRGPGRAAGFLLGSVARKVVARAEGPVVLVRAAGTGKPEEESQEPAAGGSAGGDVVVGVDLDSPDDTVFAFAFEAAARRGTALRVVHGRGPEDGPTDGAGLAGTDSVTAPLGDVLRPWQEKFPGVPVTAQAAIGQAGAHLVDASTDAALLVVGRTVRQGALGAHIGPVTDAVLRHAVSPVAVIPPT
ncbi:stress-inducible protein [Streptomyces sp. NTH33]|uniref:universal stress protein n=1 Tax=Streptomyces sp. NTH33 TaxID=1735453 RepID=UPI000DA77384|nr:universal stress protein [Streptomyces sp. NTH33]PZH17637.1 stress-inducible protein [Streptomyces sp. NTH33]